MPAVVAVVAAAGERGNLHRLNRVAVGGLESGSKKEAKVAMNYMGGV